MCQDQDVKFEDFTSRQYAYKKALSNMTKFVFTSFDNKIKLSLY